MKKLNLEKNFTIDGKAVFKEKEIDSTHFYASEEKDHLYIVGANGNVLFHIAINCEENQGWGYVDSFKIEGVTR